jgi:hypothetical protein
MMQSTDHRLRNDATKLLDRTGSRCVLAERQVRASLVVVNGVPGHDPVKVRLAEDDHMVEALASDRTDQSLDMGILPGRARCGWSIPNARPA